MSRKSSLQPEFGDLFSPAATRHIFTVGQLTSSIKRSLESQLGRIWVTGEVTNLRAQSSGHLYFTLKDASAQLSCVLFRGEAAQTRQHVQDGQKLLLGGDITVYEPRGQYQLRVASVELQGVGALQLAFEQLKRKLLAEGLFASERKRPIPRFPQRIGVATSPTGAALKDVLHVIRRRQPGLEIVLCACRVQGQDAAEEIAAAIASLNQAHGSGLVRLDLILVTRGGGSLEDLWAFNEETLARAIYVSQLPVISAVGHEIDVTISDMVADLRAATPTAAAELITEGPFASRQFVAAASDRMRRLARRRLDLERNTLDQWQGRLSRVSPRRWMQEQSQYLDDLLVSLIRGVRSHLKVRMLTSQNLASRLNQKKPSRWLADRRCQVEELTRRMRRIATTTVLSLKTQLGRLEDQLRLLSPLHVLERGYSLTTHAETGAILRSVNQAVSGDRLLTRLHDGELESQVQVSRPSGARNSPVPPGGTKN